MKNGRKVCFYFIKLGWQNVIHIKSIVADALFSIIVLQEGRVNHLAEQLGAAQARETQLEARLQAEIKRLSEEMESLKETYSSEVKTIALTNLYWELYW